MSNELWCIYLAGPDDLVAMPTKAVAEAVARNFNAVWDRYGAERGHNVRAVAHAEPWMHGKEAHAKDLREHFHEYADLVLDEDAGRFLDRTEPAPPVEAVDDYTSEGFAEWINSAYSFKGDGSFTRFNMEVAYAAGRERAALAHPRPTGDHQHEAAVDDLDDAVDRGDEGAAARALSRLTPAPTVEQAGEVTPYTAEVVAEVVRGHDGENKLSFVIEGAVEALEVGEVLYTISGLPMPDDGAADLYLSQPRPVDVPDGWKLVPVEPDDPMAAKGALWLRPDANGDATPLMVRDAKAVYRAMLAAAPAPGKGGDA